jgi:hypothetical protein
MSVSISVTLDGNGNPVTPAAPLPAARPSFAIADVAAVTCSSTIGTAVLFVPFSATRKVLHVFNRTPNSDTVDLGPTNSITSGGGIPLYAGGSFTFDGEGALGPFYAVSTGASTPLTYAEG